MFSKVLSADELESHDIQAFPYREAGEVAPITRELERVADTERAAFEQGYREGERVAQATAAERLAPARDRLAQSIEAVAALRAQLYRQAEQDVVKLAFSVATKIVRREIKIDPDIVATLVRISLEKLSQATAARVRLNPEDYRYLANRHVEGKDGGFGPGVVLVEDLRVEPGGCIIDSDAGTADARIDVQLQEVAENLLSTF